MLKLYSVLVAKIENTSISITALSPNPSHGEHQNDVIREQIARGSCKTLSEYSFGSRPLYQSDEFQSCRYPRLLA